MHRLGQKVSCGLSATDIRNKNKITYLNSFSLSLLSLSLSLSQYRVNKSYGPITTLLTMLRVSMWRLDKSCLLLRDWDHLSGDSAICFVKEFQTLGGLLLKYQQSVLSIFKQI